ncbi:Ankyrin and armadillo repeat-containing protein [Cricetulus griseus]|uniref:Ankyrin and armadillo repeat-containing protein n=1 Tax=Cricetulus griseus TaxID=10029 RepID=G3IMR6_CRIGR|nr:Ankyrin and armadillo repeat-containing protein [Cricetulus griseus]
MLRISKKGIVRFDQVQDEETYLENLAVQRNASAFFEKYDRSEVQELLTTTVVSWLSSKDDVRSQLDIPSGLMSQINNVGFSNAILLTPVDPTAHLDYREVHQILRELAVGIYCLNQIPSISLEANYDQSSSCQLPPAYYDTRIGQILIHIDYMLKALWHGIYMPKEKRTRFSELWRTIMDIDQDGKPQTSKDIFSEFSSAGIPFDLQTWTVIHVVVSLLRLTISPEKQIPILLQITSGIQALAVPFLFPMPMRMPFC